MGTSSQVIVTVVIGLLSKRSRRQRLCIIFLKQEGISISRELNKLLLKLWGLGGVGGFKIFSAAELPRLCVKVLFFLDGGSVLGIG